MELTDAGDENYYLMSYLQQLKEDGQISDLVLDKTKIPIIIFFMNIFKCFFENWAIKFFIVHFCLPSDHSDCHAPCLCRSRSMC